MSLFRDPFLWGSISQGRWSSNAWSMTHNVLMAPQEAGQTILSTPTEEITPGEYRLHGCSLTNCSQGGVRLILGDDQHAILDNDGPIDQNFTVTSANNQLIGFRDVGDTPAQIVGPLFLERIS